MFNKTNKKNRGEKSVNINIDPSDKGGAENWANVWLFKLLDLISA